MPPEGNDDAKGAGPQDTGGAAGAAPADPGAASANPAAASLVGGDGAKPGDTPQQAAFDAGKLTLPDGVAKGEAFDGFAAFAKDKGLSQEVAQDLLNMFGKQAGDFTKAQAEATKAWSDKQAGWQNEVKTEYGNNLLPVQQRISRVIDTFGSKEVRDVLNVSGAGNSPALFRFLDKVSKALDEGSHVGGAPPATSKDLASKMYPSMANGAA